MRTNGFALFRGPDSVSLAERAAERVERSCEELVVGTDAGFAPWDEGRKGNECVLSYRLGEGSDYPLVHGFVDDDARVTGGATGEYALLSRSGDSFVASRDRLGTRPLYANEDGSCIASDHRFFADSPKLLPAGATLEVDSMAVTTRSIHAKNYMGTLDECALQLSMMLTESVVKRVRGRKRVAVSFSGGLDSSIIALIASRTVDVVACSVYAAGSRDQEQAKTAAESLGLEFVGIELDRASIAKELRALDLPFEPAPMDKALWCIYSTAAREAAFRGAGLVLLGQLADELFGGYMKYSRAAGESEGAAATMMLTDVRESSNRAFIRDEEAVARFGEARFPFADESLVEFALGIPVEYKIAGGERKVVLRKAASLLGLPEALCAAPKKAAQYSSGVAKLVT